MYQISTFKSFNLESLVFYVSQKKSFFSNLISNKSLFKKYKIPNISGICKANFISRIKHKKGVITIPEGPYIFSDHLVILKTQYIRYVCFQKHVCRFQKIVLNMWMFLIKTVHVGLHVFKLLFLVFLFNNLEGFQDKN